jgi:hypothetical protein
MKRWTGWRWIREAFQALPSNMALSWEKEGERDRSSPYPRALMEFENVIRESAT